MKVARILFMERVSQVNSQLIIRNKRYSVSLRTTFPLRGLKVITWIQNLIEFECYIFNRTTLQISTGSNKIFFLENALKNY